jgi:hypothetical protein
MIDDEMPTERELTPEEQALWDERAKLTDRRKEACSLWQAAGAEMDALGKAIDEINRKLAALAVGGSTDAPTLADYQAQTDEAVTAMATKISEKPVAEMGIKGG